MNSSSHAFKATKEGPNQMFADTKKGTARLIEDLENNWIFSRQNHRLIPHVHLKGVPILIPDN